MGDYDERIVKLLQEILQELQAIRKAINRLPSELEHPE
jgi:hypothetical protein